MRQDPSHACLSEQLLETIRALSQTIISLGSQNKREKEIEIANGREMQREKAASLRQDVITLSFQCNNIILTGGENVARCYGE